MTAFEWEYKTPEGLSDLIMNSDGEFLTGLCFMGSADAEKYHLAEGEEKDLPIFQETCK